MPVGKLPLSFTVPSTVRETSISTGIAWLLRFKILVDNGLIFQSQVSYLIPIFGTILSYIFLKELIITLPEANIDISCVPESRLFIPLV